MYRPRCKYEILKRYTPMPIYYGAQNEVYNDDWAENGLIVLCFS